MKKTKPRSMKRITIVLLCLLMLSCKNEERQAEEAAASSAEETEEPSLLSSVVSEPLKLTLDQANKLAQLPLSCINSEYPNKL